MIAREDDSKASSYICEICIEISTAKNKRVFRLSDGSLKDKTAVEIAIELYNKSFVFDKNFAYAVECYKKMIDEAANSSGII